MKATGLAIVAAVLVGGGSFFAIAAPGDGQTGMITYPLWVLGGLVGLAAISAAWTKERSSFPGVLALAAIALGSVGWSFAASEAYSRDLAHRQALGKVDEAKP